MQRLAAAPAEALFGVVGRPHVERGQRVDAARVGDREVAGDFGPGADAHAVGLLSGAPDAERVQRRLAVAPDALLERAAQLGLVGLAHEIAALMVERGVQEEALVGELRSGLPGSRIPPLRRVSSCSPSASARTVTAHSLKAIGMGDEYGGMRETADCTPRAAP